MKQFNSMVIDEKGSVLVVGMLILIVLTLIGIAAINTSKVETDIAGNELSYKKEFYHADAGISWAVNNATEGWATIYNDGDDMTPGIMPAGSSFTIIKVRDIIGPTTNDAIEVQSNYDPLTGDRGMGDVGIIAGIQLPSGSGSGALPNEEYPTYNYN